MLSAKPLYVISTVLCAFAFIIDRSCLRPTGKVPVGYPAEQDIYKFLYTPADDESTGDRPSFNFNRNSKRHPPLLPLATDSVTQFVGCGRAFFFAVPVNCLAIGIHWASFDRRAI